MTRSGPFLERSSPKVARVTARKLEPVSGDGQGAQRATSTAKAAVAVVEASKPVESIPFRRRSYVGISPRLPPSRQTRTSQIASTETKSK